MEILCFHNPGEENDFLSNWYYADFEVNGVLYSSLEQYMMHRKALVFGDRETAAQIMATRDFARIKALGRQVTPYNNRVWNGIRQIVVYEGLLEKFRQNPHLKEKLLATGDALLVECAVQDTIWANGISMTDEARFRMDAWKGSNLLGFTLMQVREKLRQE